MWRVCTFEERVILAAKAGRQSAINYLLTQWEQPKNRLVTAVARQYGLSEQDAADARQEAVFWLLDAIRKYRFDGPRQRREYRLKAFLRRKLNRDMSNFVRTLRRRVRFETECRRSNRTRCVEVAGRSLRRGTGFDPTAQCEYNDLQVVLRQKLQTFGEDFPQLLTILESGGSTREAGGMLCLTDYAVRVRLQRIEREVARLLK
ncbi:MAG: hypothetical protein H6823_08875 [Planctomycetaceae bacterium]|nr:hypothetical protein [Planctomycetales bacterium]MCB9938343.1 hypothetical protein [Planctomycetaceae bacterium]